MRPGPGPGAHPADLTATRHLTAERAYVTASAPGPSPPWVKGARRRQLALLFGGSALVTLAYIGGLAASVRAFGSPVNLVEIGAVYLVAAAIAAASPTPGGVGAIEAALVAGLIGIGVRAAVAVPLS